MTSTASHTLNAANTPQVCRAENCDTPTGAGEFMCPTHWALVPPSLRDSLDATKDPEHLPSKERLAYEAAAIASVAHKEKRRRQPTPRPATTPIGKRAKPEQLRLFDIETAS